MRVGSSALFVASSLYFTSASPPPFTPFLSPNGVLNLRPLEQGATLNPLGSVGSICSAFTINGIKKSTCDTSSFTQVGSTLNREDDHDNIVVTYKSAEYIVQQSYWMYRGTNYCHLQLSIQSVTPNKLVRTNWIAPLDSVHVSYGTAIKDRRFLLVPFDNDLYNMYESVHVNSIANLERTSAYVTALHDNDLDSGGRKGLVIGAIDHDVWKTALTIEGGNLLNGELATLTAFAGYTSFVFTHDSVPHGSVEGVIVSSPKFFIGSFDDWRVGMETYASNMVRPKLQWPAGAPIVGWNSWGVYQFDLTVTEANMASDAIAKLYDSGFYGSGGIQHIGLDAELLTWPQRYNFSNHVSSHGHQQAGYYASPFSWMSGDLTGSKTCSGVSVPVLEMVKKSSNGKPMTVLDKKVFGTDNYAFDPTHPHVMRCAIEDLDNAIKGGFTLVKFDFINWGSLEGGSNPDGTNYDKQYPTGFAAYAYGMRTLRDFINGRMFISFSMAPLFPNGYAHSRRVGCDQMYGGVEYSMNQLGGGWWIENMYMLDPDLVVFGKEWIQPALDILSPIVEMDNMSRVNKAIVHGGLYLGGDDFNNPAHASLAYQYLSNAKVNYVIQTGRAFRPLFSIEDDFIAPHVFELDASRIPGHNCVYIAAFNYGPLKKTFKYKLTTTSITSGSTTYTNVWDGTTSTLPDSGYLTLEVSGKSSVLLEFPSHVKTQVISTSSNGVILSAM